MASQRLKLYEINCSGMPTINIGSLRHSVTIQAQTPSSPPAFDNAGQVTEWTDFATVGAAIQNMRGDDMIRGGLGVAQLHLTVSMWYLPGVQPNMRVVHRDAIYIIQSVDNVLEMDTVLVLNCIALGLNGM